MLAESFWRRLTLQCWRNSRNRWIIETFFNDKPLTSLAPQHLFGIILKHRQSGIIRTWVLLRGSLQRHSPSEQRWPENGKRLAQRALKASPAHWILGQIFDQPCIADDLKRVSSRPQLRTRSGSSFCKAIARSDSSLRGATTRDRRCVTPQKPRDFPISVSALSLSQAPSESSHNLFPRETR